MDDGGCSADILAWSGGRAVIGTGSLFQPVRYDGRLHVIGQANNAFVFPGIGLGVIVARDALYPCQSELREVSRRVAIAVVRCGSRPTSRTFPLPDGGSASR